jgi:predicted nuclease of restriction endonuclease-like (RecB) superfamily
MTSLASRWSTGITQCGVARLPWSLVTTLLDSFPDRATAEFYAQRAIAEGWTRPALQSMIASRLHERTQPALTTFDYSVPATDRDAVRDIVKDPFILDFLAADPVRERDLSKALTDNLTRFLRELGTGFSFVGAEVPVPCGDREFFVDLLFYHYRLHRFVVFELKLGRFEPEYVGKLNFYVQLVDDHLREQARDDPTLGMLLVVGRDDVTVEVALRGVTTPLAVTEWRRLPAKVRQALPTAEDLTATVTRTVREIESTTAAALRPSGGTFHHGTGWLFVWDGQREHWAAGQGVMEGTGARFQPARLSNRRLSWPSQTRLGVTQRSVELVAVRVAEDEDVNVPDGARPITSPVPGCPRTAAR